MAPPAVPVAITDAMYELAPLLRRCVDLQPSTVVRIRVAAGAASALLLLPFGVLVGRTVRLDEAAHEGVEPLDVVWRATETLAWLTGAPGPGTLTEPPQSRAHEWVTGTPPRSGWRRVETVPGDVIRPLVRKGALALQEAAAREGVPGAQPRAEVADALLDAVVLSVDDADAGNRPHIEITLRALSALTRMGFLTHGGPAHIDVVGRWVRVAGGYGSVYLERPGAGLGLRVAPRL